MRTKLSFWCARHRRILTLGWIIAFLSTSVVGCMVWREIPVTKVDLEKEDLQTKRLRITTKAGNYELTVETLDFPILRGTGHRLTAGGDPVEGSTKRYKVDLRRVLQLEVYEFDPWKTAGAAGLGALGVAGIVAVAGVGAVTIFVLTL